MEANLSHAEFPFLKELGIEEVNFGVYRSGEWVGHGPQYTAVNPHDNRPIAKIVMGNEEDYESCIAAMERTHRSRKAIRIILLLLVELIK